MSIDVVTTVLAPAVPGPTGAAYDLCSLADVKTDLNVPAGTPYSTASDTPSGQVLNFASTYGISKGAPVTGLNIPAGATATNVTATAVTLSVAISGDIPAGTVILFNDDTTIDVFLARAITLASAAIAKYCNRQFPIETIQDQFNFLPGYYRYDVDESRTVLQLSKLPLVAVTSITVNDPAGAYALTQGVDFAVDMARAQLIRLDSTTGLPARWDTIQTVAVYTAGFATIPADVDDACSRLTKKGFWTRGRDPSVMEQSTGQMGTTKYWVNPSPDGNLPADVADLLDNYRFMVFA